MANTTEIINDMEHTNIVTFNTINGETMQQVTLDNEPMIARPFTCYNWEIILNNTQVCINPSFYDGYCKPLTVEGDELWVIYNFKEVLLYNNATGEFLGTISKVLDPRNIAERIEDLQKEGKI